MPTVPPTSNPTASDGGFTMPVKTVHRVVTVRHASELIVTRPRGAELGGPGA